MHDGHPDRESGRISERCVVMSGLPFDLTSMHMSQGSLKRMPDKCVYYPNVLVMQGTER